MAAAAQAAANANTALLAALDSREIPNIRKAMTDYADKVQGVRLQSAAFELLSRVNQANDEELDKLIAEMHRLATTRMERRKSTDDTNMGRLREELAQQKNKLRKVGGGRRRSLPPDLNNALMQGPAAARARLRHVEVQERPSIHPGMRLHDAELRHIERVSKDGIPEDDDDEEAAEPPRMSRKRSSRNEVGVAGQEQQPAAAAPLLKKRSSSKAAVPLLTKRSSQRGGSTDVLEVQAMEVQARVRSSQRPASNDALEVQARLRVSQRGASNDAIEVQAALRASKRDSATDAMEVQAALRASKRGSKRGSATEAMDLQDAAAAPLPLSKRSSSRRGSATDATGGGEAAAPVLLSKRSSSRRGSATDAMDVLEPAAATAAAPLLTRRASSARASSARGASSRRSSR